MLKSQSPLLLVVCVLSLAVGVLGTLLFVREAPVVEGQASGAPASQYIMATAGPSTKGVTECFVFDTKTQRLASYTVDNVGMRLLGSRQLTFDLIPKSISPRGKRLSVDDVRKLVDKDES